MGGCGTLPFSRMAEPYTARTLGKGNNEVGVSLASMTVLDGEMDQQLMAVLPIFFRSIEYKRGIFNNFDLAGFFGQNRIAGALYIGLEGKYQLFHKDKHSFSIFSGGGGGAAGIKAYFERPYYFSYIGSIYSFKPNDKYEFALNLRVNHGYGYNFPLTKAQAFGPLVENFVKDLLTEYDIEAERSSEPPEYTNLIYPSLNMSHTWWFITKFGATLHLSIIPAAFVLGLDSDSDFDSDSVLFKLGYDFHYNF